MVNFANNEGIPIDTVQEILDKYFLIKKMNNNLNPKEISKYFIQLEEIEDKIKELGQNILIFRIYCLSRKKKVINKNY
jgi:hypothetical protein